jgi:hypothetical protein
VGKEVYESSVVRFRALVTSTSSKQLPIPKTLTKLGCRKNQNAILGPVTLGLKADKNPFQGPASTRIV